MCVSDIDPLFFAPKTNPHVFKNCLRCQVQLGNLEDAKKDMFFFGSGVSITVMAVMVTLLVSFFKRKHSRQ